MKKLSMKPDSGTHVLDPIITFNNFSKLIRETYRNKDKFIS